MAQLVLFDTETTGLLPKTYNINANNSLPHVIQLGAILIDTKNLVEVGNMNVHIKPEGFEIPLDSTKIHGVTNEYATEHGINLHDAVDRFNNLIRGAEGLIGHNIQYDSCMMSLEYARSGRDPSLIYGKPKFCTMKATENICKLPGKYPGSYKWPKLTEAYKYLFGEDMEGAHDAMVDIRATFRIYKHLMKNRA